MKDALRGHERVRNILSTSLENHRISHAYLFHGIEGIGKKMLALDFAYRLLTIGAKHTQELIWKKISEGNHPDIQIVGTEDGSIKIEDVEGLQEFLRSKPLEASYKVAVIDNAHQLTEQAQNRLLKTLEEPPQYAVLLLVTHRPGEILTTIHSRVESLSMSPLSVQHIVEILRFKNCTGDISIDVAAAMSEGSALRALRIATEPQYMQMRDFIIEWFSDIINGSALIALRKLDRQEMDKAGADLALMFLRMCLRDLLVIGQGAEQHSIMKDASAQLISLSQKIHPRKALMMLSAVDKAEKSLDRLVQPLLVMDVLSHTLQEVNRG